MLRSRTIAIAGSFAALSFAATPFAAVAATTHHSTTSAVRTERSLDRRDVPHVDRTPDRADRTGADSSQDARDS
jgi:hypothetical protein